MSYWVTFIPIDDEKNRSYYEKYIKGIILIIIAGIPEEQNGFPESNDKEKHYQTDFEEDDSIDDDETGVKNLILTIEEKDKCIKNPKKELFDKESCIDKLLSKIDLLQKSRRENEKIIERLETQLNSKPTNNMTIVLQSKCINTF